LAKQRREKKRRGGKRAESGPANRSESRSGQDHRAGGANPANGRDAAREDPGVLLAQSAGDYASGTTPAASAPASEIPTDSEGATDKRRVPWKARIGLMTLLAVLGVGGYVLADWWTALPEGTAATYVGRSKCIECHKVETGHWIGSHHDLAMDFATPETVLADFSGEFEHEGFKCRFFKRDGKYFVHTEDEDGKYRDFEVKYVFGVDPLQQYMVEFPSERQQRERERQARRQDAAKGVGQQAESGKNGKAGEKLPDYLPRVQVLNVAWDTNKKEWFSLTPGARYEPGDPMHWTGWGNTWNHMCAECHSTNVQKNYDPRTREYHTTFSEMDVSCEACHGPGSRHVELAESKSIFWDRRYGKGLTVTLKNKHAGKEGNQARGTVADAKAELESCARCHSHKAMIRAGFEPGRHALDHYHFTPLREGAYFPDGQILDEVYVYGSFLQSRMYREGVRCTNCHNPHSNKLKLEGNAVCTQCHTPGKYDVPAHHHHAQGSVASRCVECHMPHRVYMEVDPRRDHSLRSPRPDVSHRMLTLADPERRMAVPNACTGCHVNPAKKFDMDHARAYAELLTQAGSGPARDDKTRKARQRLTAVDKEMAAAVVKWYGPERPQPTHYGEIIHAARFADQQRFDDLVRIAFDEKNYGPNVRATAVELLANYDTRGAADAIAKALKDGSALVRASAVTALARSPYFGQRLRRDPKATQEFAQLAAAQLDDPRALVRDEAARALTLVPKDLLELQDRELFEKRLQEYVAAQESMADLWAPHLNLGGIKSNQAQLAMAAGDRARAEELFRQAEVHFKRAIEVNRISVPARQMLMQLYRAQGRDAEAEKMQREIVELLPDSPDGHLALALMVSENRRRYDEAAKILSKAAEKFPHHARTHFNLGALLRFQGKYAEAEKALRRAVETEPDSPEFVAELAAVYQDQGEWEKADRLLAPYLEKKTPEPRILGAKFDLLMAQDKTQEATKLALQKTAGQATRPDYAMLLANLYLRQGNINEAAAVLQSALATEEGRGDARLAEMLASIYVRQNQWGAAEQIFQRALTLASTPEIRQAASRFYTQRALTLLQSGQFEPARAAAMRAVELDPSSGRARSMVNAAEQAIEQMRRRGG